MPYNSGCTAASSSIITVVQHGGERACGRRGVRPQGLGLGSPWWFLVGWAPWAAWLRGVGYLTKAQHKIYTSRWVDGGKGAARLGLAWPACLPRAATVGKPSWRGRAWGRFVCRPGMGARYTMAPWGCKGNLLCVTTVCHSVGVVAGRAGRRGGRVGPSLLLGVRLTVRGVSGGARGGVAGRPPAWRGRRPHRQPPRGGRPDGGRLGRLGTWCAAWDVAGGPGRQAAASVRGLRYGAAGVAAACLAGRPGAAVRR